MGGQAEEKTFWTGERRGDYPVILREVVGGNAFLRKKKRRVLTREDRKCQVFQSWTI